jgi:hypothetical protein
MVDASAVHFPFIRRNFRDQVMLGFLGMREERGQQGRGREGFNAVNNSQARNNRESFH